MKEYKTLIREIDLDTEIVKFNNKYTPLEYHPFKVVPLYILNRDGWRVVQIFNREGKDFVILEK